MAKKEKDFNIIKESEIDELKYLKLDIDESIKNLENEFDDYDYILQNIETYKDTELSKIHPIITIKEKDNKKYVFTYFRIENRKWIKNNNSPIIRFTIDDILFILKHKNEINMNSLRWIMTEDNYNLLKTLSKLEDDYNLKFDINKEINDGN